MNPEIKFEYPEETPSIAREVWTKAINGDATAQLELGKIYFNSGFNANNNSKAFEWVSRSAKQGNVEAQFRLGNLYALGWGTDQCRTSAYDWYTKAAIQGYKKALIRIHNLYQEDLRIHCRGQLNLEEREWADCIFKYENNIRELNEYRLKMSKSILHDIVDYYTNQFEKWKASNQEDPNVQQSLGFLYQHGFSVRKISSVAIAYYTKAAEQGLVGAQYNLGLLYQQDKNIKFNYRKAFHWYSLAANGGNINAQAGLAYFYEKGLATEIDYQKALMWYTRAADSGHSMAQVTLGKWYRKGEYVQQDTALSFKWYNLAAKQGNLVAQNCLDMLYQNGKITGASNGDGEDVPEYSIEASRQSRLCSKLRQDIDKITDRPKIKRLHKLALNSFRGDGNAMWEIGLDYNNGDTFIQNKDIGFKWIRNAANAGSKQALLKLVEMYKQGDTIEQDYHKTSIWTKKLAKSKGIIGQYNLGMLYKEGLGVRRDFLEASKWFIFSADQEHRDAMYELGFMKEQGISFDMDIKEATEWYAKSAKRGNLVACCSLGNLYLRGIKIEKDINKGLKMIDYAAKKGFSNAQYMMGGLYEKGEDVTQDITKATEYYSKISSDGGSEVLFRLAAKYLNGTTVNQDKKKAYDFFKKAIEKVNFYITNVFHVPIRYSNEIENYYNLVDMFIEVSKQSIDDMQYNIGYMYEHGVFSYAMEEVFVKDCKSAIEWYSISAAKGDFRAHYRLGIIHEEGKGIKQNFTAAIEYYKKAANNDNTDAKYRLACMYLVGYVVPQDVIKSFYLFMDAANMGHSKSRKALLLLDSSNSKDSSRENNLVEDFFNQDSKVKITESDQLYMLETVAEQGLVAVQYQLGQIYQEKDDSRCIKWLTLAAQGGISDACYRLGVLCEEGKYTKQDYTKAIELYEIAVEGDHEDAIYRLARMYQFGKGTPIDYTKAYNLYYRASEMEHRLAFKILNITGEPYKNSIGTMEKNRFDIKSEGFKQSLLLCEYVAEQENADLQYKVGTVYENHLLKPDHEKAFKWYKMASSGSHREAIYRLGLLYEKGLGTNVDYEKAHRLFEKAKEMNSGDAVLRLATVYHYGNGANTEPLKAIEHYTLAANIGNPLSQCKIGELYEKGELFPKNIIEALKWYTKAYLQGYDNARSKLFQMYDNIPYEEFFYRKLNKIMERIVTAGLNTTSLTGTEQDNFDNSCTRLGYWYYQHKEFERAWEYFSKPFDSPFPGLRSIGLFENKFIGHKEKVEILNSLNAREELLDKFSSQMLYYLGMVYYNGVSEESSTSETEKDNTEVIPFGSENQEKKKITVIEQDYSKAFFFLEKAAEKDNSDAQYQLGIMYQHGQGIEINIERAQKWYSSAITIDKIHAYNVGKIYHCDGPLQDFSKALEDYKITTFIDVKVETGILYQYGCGVEQSYKKAIAYYNETGFCFNIFPHLHLALAYYYAEDDIRDYKRAFQLFQNGVKRKPNDERKMIFARRIKDSEDNKASEKYSFTLEPEGVFHGEAYYYLGIMYKNGQGTVKDEVKARKCFLKAIELNNERAKKYIE